MSKSWRRALTVLVGAAVAASVLVIPAIGQSPVTGDVGVLSLHLGSDGDRFVFEPNASTPNLVQTLTSTNCQLVPGGPDSLVSVIGAGTQTNKRPFAGLKDHRIGVGQNGEGNGEPCARINKDLGQFLTLSLTGELAGAAINYAEIDLGFKFNGSAQIDLKLEGSLVDSVIINCTGGSDCGPDSGGTDNERVVLYVDDVDAPDPDGWVAVQVDDVFDTIVFTPGAQPSNGSISLEGGFNGAPAGPSGTTDTIFNIVEVFDGEIDCGQTKNLGGGADPAFQTTRGNDIDGTCKGPDNGLVFNFDAGLLNDGRQFVDFVVTDSTGSSGTAQFLEVITWTSSAPPDTDAGDDQLATLTYDDHVGAGERVMPWCLKDPRVGGALLGTPEDPVDTTLILPDTHTSCLISSESHVTTTGSYVTEDTVYGIADGFRVK